MTTRELDAALARLEELAEAQLRSAAGRGKKRPELPSRYDARALLVALEEKAPCGNPKERRRTKACKDASGKLLRKRLSACGCVLVCLRLFWTFGRYEVPTAPP